MPRQSYDRRVMRTMSSLILVAGGLLGCSTAAVAQSPPPISGVTGTIALESTDDQLYRAANTIIVKATDGWRHACRFTKEVLFRGGKGSGPGALEDRREGTTVAASDPPAGAPITHATCGTVRTIDSATLMIARSGHRGNITVVLTPSTNREGPIVVGSAVSVRYQDEGRRHVATAIAPQRSRN